MSSVTRTTGAERLVLMLRKASSATRARVLASVPRNTRAAVHFAIAPAPELVEVTSNATFQTRPLTLTDPQAEYLAALGRRVTRSDPKFAAQLAGFSHSKGERFIVDAPAWAARCSVDERLAGWVADGSVSVRVLAEDEARAYALREYVLANSGRDPSATSGPQLPEI